MILIRVLVEPRLDKLPTPVNHLLVTSKKLESAASPSAARQITTSPTTNCQLRNIKYFKKTDKRKQKMTNYSAVLHYMSSGLNRWDSGGMQLLDPKMGFSNGMKSCEQVQNFFLVLKM